MDSPGLPNFAILRPIGTIYTYRLEVPTRDYFDRMPGVTDRIEWFAIDYEGNFWLTEAGEYRWSLTSDDGSCLYIDGNKIVDNDRQHETATESGRAKLATGQHHIRVSYFQGPRFAVALVLAVATPGRKMRIFDMREFREGDSATDDGAGTRRPICPRPTRREPSR